MQTTYRRRGEQKKRGERDMDRDKDSDRETEERERESRGGVRAGHNAHYIVQLLTGAAMHVQR